MTQAAMAREPETMEDLFGPVIYSYTRAQALADGVLIDVSETAREANFRWPVAITAGLHALIEDIPEEYKGIQDCSGRLWDVLWMAYCAIKRGADGREIRYSLIMHHPTARGIRKRVTLKMVSGPVGPDDPSPCLTIMLPDED